MRSSKREDLNIQSNFTSSFLSRSCRLPREQCSVTTANMEPSKKKPRKGFTFSFLRSFICQFRRVLENILHHITLLPDWLSLRIFLVFSSLFCKTLSVPLWKSWWCSASLLWNGPLEISSATPSRPGGDSSVSHKTPQISFFTFKFNWHQIFFIYSNIFF